jgi:ATP-dependent Lhr-like helicase
MGALTAFSSPTRDWFTETFGEPTRVQTEGWPAIAGGEHALLLAPTGSGKTLAAFLSCIDRLLFAPPPTEPGARVVYVSPLKALVYDVERNLRAPLVGIQRTAERQEVAARPIRVDVRTGDTPQTERRRMLREPGDILVTTPESLYLMLTSGARETLRNVETVIVDEIHVMAGSKRGAHLALSLERLAELTETDPQRVGLSATQRPLERIQGYLGGSRAVHMVDASEPPHLELAIHVPVEDMERPPSAAAVEKKRERLSPEERRKRARAGEGEKRSLTPAGPSSGEYEYGVWPSIYPELLEHIRAHRSTIVFTNSRLLCERLAKKLNELAGEELVKAHHGSISHARRAEIEEQLKRGELPALIATSSLELGIDMGAVDLVVLVESPGTVASGLQRVGRAGHGVGEVSNGLIYPKFRGDILECAVVAQRMASAEIESTKVPRNCLDVLAQQVVAMVAMDPWKVPELHEVVRRAAPFRELGRELLDGVLDMLAGRYPSDDFAELSPRVNWDRATDEVTPRRSARTLAVMNAGTIPDRGLYRVHVGADGVRLGELDEEMVYETRVGDHLILGASTWRVDEIDQDRVVVSPAPGQPGRLPFWRGERVGRPLELGRAVGAFLREAEGKTPRAIDGWLKKTTVLDGNARKNLAAYVAEQKEATGRLPTDRTIVVERFQDELGDWRICLLTPFGSRVHAPWALALEATLASRTGFDVQVLYSDEGIALQVADTEELPPLEDLFCEPEEVEDLVVDQLSHSALFAARFRENAARALLLPRRRFAGRTPLWLQRRKSTQLLAVSRQYPSFPMVLETYRECLQDVFDVPALVELMTQVRARDVRVHDVQTRKASPFARGLVFQYVAQYLYEGDAPLAARKAAALSRDRGLLRELLGQEELRDLLVPEAVDEVEAELQRLDPETHIRHADGVHDLLRRLGDLDADEIGARCSDDPAPWLEELRSARRALQVRVGGATRWIAAEDAARYRDGLGVALPPGLPSTFLETSDRPVPGLLRRWARTHGPFLAADVAQRFGLVEAQVLELLLALVEAGDLVHADIRPGGFEREFCDPDVLRRLRRRSLAYLRDEVAPVEGDALGRFLLGWHGVGTRRRLNEALDVIEGVPLPYSDLVDAILPARVPDFDPRQLDELGASGQLVWVGRGALGTRDGKVALYRRERAPLLVEVEDAVIEELEPPARRLYDLIDQRGAAFLLELQASMEGTPSDELMATLWDLVWKGLVTNDTFGPLRGLGRRRRRRRGGPNAEIGGRWSTVRRMLFSEKTETERAVARAQVLLERHGIVAREAVGDEPGGFSALYPVLREMEESGRARRGLFVDGLGGAQFALPGAVDRLRAARQGDGAAHVLAATDPASPWGSLLPWPGRGEGAKPRRAAGARVVVVDGVPVLWLDAAGRGAILFGSVDEDPTLLSKAIDALRRARGFKSLTLQKVDGVEAQQAGRAALLRKVGFDDDYRGLTLAP